MRRLLNSPVLPFLLAAATASAAEPLPAFEAQEIDPHAGNVVYALNVADVNGDGTPDVCALTEGAIVYARPRRAKVFEANGEPRTEELSAA